MEEALCFGWIDGVMKKIDDNSYLKYFSMRRKSSKWSVKKTYTRAYLDAKTDDGRIKRLEWRMDSLREIGFTEKDWKLFRNKMVDWQEAYMDRLNKEYIELLSEAVNPSDKFWGLEKRIKEDKKKTGVRAEMSRSNLIYNITSLIYEGAISYEDLEEFSDELKETVRFFTTR